MLADPEMAYFLKNKKWAILRKRLSHDLRSFGKLNFAHFFPLKDKWVFSRVRLFLHSEMGHSGIYMRGLPRKSKFSNAHFCEKIHMPIKIFFRTVWTR